MRMTRYDKRMAIQRHPAFIKDNKEYLKLRDLYQLERNETNELKMTAMAVEIYQKWGEEYEAIVQADRMSDKFKKRPNCIKEVRMIERLPISLLYVRREDSITKTEVTGERLYLEVEINEGITNLKDEFERIIRKYQDVLQKGKSKNKETEYAEPWKVYDMQKGGLNPHQIAQELSGIDKSSDDRLQPWYKSVRTAYKKALSMIEQVGKEAKQQ